MAVPLPTDVDVADVASTGNGLQITLVTKTNPQGLRDYGRQLLEKVAAQHGIARPAIVGINPKPVPCDEHGRPVVGNTKPAYWRLTAEVRGT